jgi:hypothetical protein
MSIPVTFAFDFTKVMSLDSSAFLYGNFAKSGATPASVMKPLMSSISI